VCCLARGRFRVGDETLTAPAGTWLIPFLLLLLRDGVSYGDELEERLNALGVAGMRPKEVYQSLREMEWEGLVRCDREDNGHGNSGISEWRCEITEVSQAYLEFWVNSLNQYRKEMDLFLSTYAGTPAKGVRG
jgi:DNA-binding PadR family transcriptional regulator